MYKLGIKVHHVIFGVSVALIIASVVALVFLGKGTLQYPLLGHHCMKNAKSIQVPYNMVHYRDFLSEYVDRHVTADNPRGKRGNIFRYESPLSAFTLAGLFSMVDSADFMTRVNTARYFTLFSLIGAYFLVGFFVLRKNVFALSCFSFIIVTSFFTVTYSTKPQAETFSILYQALFLTIATGMHKYRISPSIKSLIIACLSVLLCVGGKMNYFLIAIPIIVIYPFIDQHFKGIKLKFKYYLLFIVCALVVLGALFFVVKFNFKSAFIYFIKGNKPIIENDLWKTFLEGFDSFTIVWERTRDHFGPLNFWGGVLGTVYLFIKTVFVLIKKIWKIPSEFELFQVILFSFIVGHAINYLALRNLYIPHRYYVVPLFMLFALAFTVALCDLRSILFVPGAIKKRITLLFSRIKTKMPIKSVSISKTRYAHLVVFWTFGILLVVFTYITHYIASQLTSDVSLRVSCINAVKYLGVVMPAYAFDKEILDFASSLNLWSRNLQYITGGFFAVNIVCFFVFRKEGTFHRVFQFINGMTKKLKISAAGSALAGILIVLATYEVIQNGEMYFNEEEYMKEHIEMESKLAKIRKNSVPGDTVLCWKWCYAFYADKRSITEPREEDLDYYIENDLKTILGPVRPLNVYYNRVKGYKRPATYYKLKKREEIERIKERRMKKKLMKKNKVK